MPTARGHQARLVSGLKHAVDLTLLSRRKAARNSFGNRNLDRSRGTLEETMPSTGRGMRGLGHSVRTQSATVVRGTHSLPDADLQKHFAVNIRNKSKTVDSLQIIYKYLAPDLGAVDGQPRSEYCYNAEYYSGNIYGI